MYLSSSSSQCCRQSFKVNVVLSPPISAGIREAGTLVVVRNVVARAPKLMSSFLSPVSAGIREACTLVVEARNIAARVPKLMSSFLPLFQPGSEKHVP